MAVVVRERPRVAVVTPSLDMARFLPETVESVLAQDYPHIDYLVMDGGSCDGSVELLRGYGDRVRFVSAADAGQADAVNRGFARTRGEIFTFLNADDIYRRGAVSAAVDALERRPTAGVVYGDADYVDDRGSVIGRYPTRAFDARRLAEECFICQPAAFVRREAWTAAGGLDARLHFALDYDFWIRLSRVVPFVYLERPLATSRMHRENKTLGSRAAHYREVIAVLKRHYGRWTDSLVLLRVRVPTGTERARIELEPTRPGAGPPRVVVAVDGRRVAVSSTEEAIDFELRGGGGESTIALAFDPYRPARDGLDDPRRLGVAVRSLRFEPGGR